MLLASKEGREASQALLQFGGLGCSLAATVALFSWLGSLLDQRLGSAPAGLCVGCLVGAAAGLYKLIRDVVALSEEPPGAADQDPDARA